MLPHVFPRVLLLGASVLHDFLRFLGLFLWPVWLLLEPVDLCLLQRAFSTQGVHVLPQALKG